MLRSILIGLDGSEDSNAARELGLRWAKDLDALAVGVAVADEPGVLASTALMFTESYATPCIEPLLSAQRYKTAQSISKFSRRCTYIGVRHETLEEVGTPYVQILTEAQRYDLVVLGQRTHFEYGWESSADETLLKVLRESPRPVVVVPAVPRTGEAIVVAYDGSLQSARALAAFEASGVARSRPVHVVSVSHDRAVAIQTAFRAVDFLNSHAVDARAVPINTALAPAGIILDQVYRLGAGLLVMGAYGQPVLREFFLGSVTRSALESSEVPVFCYH